MFSLLFGLCSCNSDDAKNKQNNEDSKPVEVSEKDSASGVAEASKELQFVCACLKYEYVKEMKDEEIIRKAIEGLLSTLDPHTCYLNEKAFNSLKTLTDGEFGGLGIEIIIDENFIRIISPIDDTPADKAGLKSGDLIIAIDDECISGISAEEALEKLRGKPGSSVKLKIKRGDKVPFDITIKRDLIKIQSVKAEVLDDVGYIRISTFDKNTCSSLRKFLEENKNLKGIILDVRNNPGGLLDEAVSVSNLFLKEGKIVSTKGRMDGNTKEFFADGADITNGIPIVILINNGTASAPEILAGALRDNKRAVVVGMRSFGKGSVQKIIPLSEKTAMKLTVAKHYTPSGECIQGNGISPDIEADYASVKKIEGVFTLREEFFNNALDSKDIAKKHPNAKKLPDFSVENKKEKEENIDFRKMPLKERIEKDYQLNKAFDTLKAINVYEKIRKEKVPCKAG